MILDHFIDNNIPTDDIHFATKIDNGLNNEKTIKLNGGRVVKPDFLYGEKIIEFYGDYWHSEERGTIDRDIERENFIRDNGYGLLIVNENDFKTNENKILNECLYYLINN